MNEMELGKKTARADVADDTNSIIELTKGNIAKTQESIEFGELAIPYLEKIINIKKEQIEANKKRNKLILQGSMKLNPEYEYETKEGYSEITHTLEKLAAERREIDADFDLYKAEKELKQSKEMHDMNKERLKHFQMDLAKAIQEFEKDKKNN